jgi:signal transduction histidine kinase
MRLLSNLVSNAIKHADGGVVAVTAKPDGAQAVFQVSNTGVLPERDVFAAYEKGTDSTGQGLGLAIIQQLAVNNGFTLTHHSDVQSGTVFRLSLPRVV